MGSKIVASMTEGSIDDIFSPKRLSVLLGGSCSVCGLLAPLASNALLEPLMVDE